jgi:hypothetical protein
VVGEGPGHQRDSELVTSSTDLYRTPEDRGIEFIDLNRDELIKVKMKATFSGLADLCCRAPRSYPTSSLQCRR